MLMTSAPGTGLTATQRPSRWTCSPDTPSWRRSVTALGSLCPGSPYVSSGCGHAWRVVVHRHVLRVPPHGLHHVASLEPKALRYRLQQPERQRSRLRRVGADYFPAQTVSTNCQFISNSISQKNTPISLLAQPNSSSMLPHFFLLFYYCIAYCNS